MIWPAIELLVADIKSGKQSATALVAECLSEIKKQTKYHAVLEVNPQATSRAQAIDKDIKAGKTRGRLLGIPFVAKDNFLTHDTHTTAASNILKPFKAPYQATAIERLEAEGAIMIAKTNLDAFAHGSSTENSDFGPTHNPFDFEYVPGGSSGGSAAAVALGLAAFGLGTDTGGSIRLPASFCGVVGLKPTYGLVSRYGVIAMASSTDTIGPLARSVEDAALVLDVMAGEDRYDGTTIERDPKSYADIEGNLKGLKVGIVKEHLAAGVDKPVAACVKAVIEQLEDGGAQVEEISIPVDELALAVYYILVPAEVSSNLARYDGVKFGHSSHKATSLEEIYELSRAEGFGAEAKRRILIGTYVLSSGYYDAYYKQAQTVRTKLVEEYKKAFTKHDVLIGPTSPTLPFKLGQKQDPLTMYLSDVATVAVNLTGMPGISVPVGSHEGLPIGLQVMADQRAERKLLGVAQMIAEITHD